MCGLYCDDVLDIILILYRVECLYLIRSCLNKDVLTSFNFQSCSSVNLNEEFLKGTWNISIEMIVNNSGLQAEFTNPLQRAYVMDIYLTIKIHKRGV